ncbi:hypothetical protein EJ05DRAFT_498496 [Pseudovirgaria hyperparasitica]|uniref:AhpC/TSA antioxidant enzyme-domain-containing protein n=1 Tax=Pseudovirgaria hyperparasitica TaxID=470096 RepID=A0A6A6WES4_9PEZI|nr:uncharacterized protein EJ05DRAFT_498496 [Pseudovirgaria hyperparasitica]KAF2760534.1 hypothetical protein EJ05DRAFT_498496 [Pseudovirgaria hyperparasitica]
MVKLRKAPPPGYYTSQHHRNNNNESLASPISVSSNADSVFSRYRANSASTAGTAPSTAPTSPTTNNSCSLNNDAWFERFHDSTDETDELPSHDQLDLVGDIPIYDSEGNSRSFRSLYSGESVIGERQFVVFIRHFYCGACQAYLKALTTSIDPATYFGMDTPTSIVIIGCGSPSMIQQYKDFTGTNFPIFAEPTRRLYKGLGMSWTLDAGKQRPAYMQDISKPQWVAGQIKQIRGVKGLRMKLAGGNPLQVGGEFLFSEEGVVWCHRMKNYRGHAEVETVRRVLEID